MSGIRPHHDRVETMTMDAPAVLAARGRPSERRLATRWLLAGIGLAFLAALVYGAGPQLLLRHLRALGWGAPLVLVPYAVACIFDAAGWRATFVHARPSLGLLYVVRLIGEALNSVTPTAYLGGEPVKAYVLQRFGVPLAEGTTSVILAKTALTVAQIAFVVLGVALLAGHEGLDSSSLIAVVAATVAGAAVAALVVHWQHRGLVTFVAGVARRLFPRARVVERLHRRAPEVDARLREFYGARRSAALASVLLHLVGWVVGAAEVYVILRLIGHPVGWQTAIVIEALAQPTRLLGVAVPGTLGVQEAGGMLIFALLGMAPELGLATMLLKRAREIAFSLLGLALLPRLYPAR
jgi:putative membrane protein